MSPVATASLRIGDLARAAGTTTRTVRYYEEIGLLAGPGDRPAGGHRLYTQADVDRLREIVRLKELLGVSLEELKQLVEAEDARSLLRREWREDDPAPARREEILTESLGHLERQLALLRHRRAELDKLERELVARLRSVRTRLRDLRG